MSTIAILTPTENGANSLIDINANFANLNADKLEISALSNLVPKTRELTINGVTHDLSVDQSWTISAGTGDVTGPAGSTTDDIVLFNGTTGKLLKDSGVKVTDFATSANTLQLDQTVSQTIINGQPIQNTLTASQIVATDSNKKLQTLAVSIYPSLIELSYVKGATSAIQTQLNAKGSGTVTNVAAITLGTTGTDLSSTVANPTTTPVITLNVPTASASNRGALSAADWTTFNAKAPIASPIFTGIVTLPSYAVGVQTIATTGGTTTFTSASPTYTVFTGTQSQTLVLPNATTLSVGQRYMIDNDSTQEVTINTNGGAELWRAAANTDCYITLLTNGTAAGTWEVDYMGIRISTGKKLTVSNTLTLAGTDGTTMTFPSTSSTVVTTAQGNIAGTAANLSGTPALPNGTTATTQSANDNSTKIATTAYVDANNTRNNAITATANAATANIAFRVNTITNNSAATLTITIPTSGAVDGQMVMIRVKDFSAVAQTVTWVNTENGEGTAPILSNGSTTLPRAAGYQFNSATTKWRCIAA